MLPRFVKAAAVVTEDRSFYAHKGIRWDLIGRALRMDVRKGRYVYGGSTITARRPSLESSRSSSSVGRWSGS